MQGCYARLRFLAGPFAAMAGADRGGRDRLFRCATRPYIVRAIGSEFRMQGQALVVFLAVGLAAGFLASFVVGGSGLVRHLVTGVIGAFVGGLLLGDPGIGLGIANPLTAQIVTATIGAVVVVIVARFIA